MSSSPRKWSSDNGSLEDVSETAGSDWELETGDEELFRTRPRKSPSLPARLWNLIPGTPSRRKVALNESSHKDGGLAEARWKLSTKPKGKWWIRWLFWRLPITFLCCFGFLHIILVFLGRKSLFWDRAEYSPTWASPATPGYPTDATRDVAPIPCHSHNDYWRRIPLFDALSWGCTGIEADVWQVKGTDELLVGHSKSSLTRNRTFTSLYIKPLVTLLDSMNPTTEFAETSGHGIFDEDPEQTLVLLVDFKTDGEKLFPIVQRQLQPLREKDYLSHWDGKDFIPRAVTVVGTGDAPFDLITANTTYRDIFFDAPLDEFYDATASAADDHPSPHHPTRRGQGESGTALTTPDSFNSSNSYYASTSFSATIGLPYGGLSARQLDLLRGQIRGAHDRGLKARYWETPFWPTSLRNHVWEVLVREGADMLNVDDLQAAAKFDWRRTVPHRWIDA